MLVRTQALFTTKEDKKRKGAGIALMLIIMSSLGALLLTSGLSGQFGDFNASPAVDFTEIGEMMLTYYAPALIILGLTLAGSVIAALALARRESITGEQEEEEEEREEEKRHRERTT
jgi:NADH:ubiquinone oxidoreductase subunit 6 (subunit J)